MASYATPSDLADRFDARTLRDLASDTGEAVADITSDPHALVALADASGRVDAAVLVGGLYTTDQLGDLTGNSLALLKRLVCDLAMCYMMSRRPERYGSEALAAMHKAADEYLELLRKGERLFDVDVAIAAGRPTVDGPVVTDYETMNLIPDRTSNFYPSRGSRLPIGRA